MAKQLHFFRASTALNMSCFTMKESASTITQAVSKKRKTYIRGKVFEFLPGLAIVGRHINNTMGFADFVAKVRQVHTVLYR